MLDHTTIRSCVVLVHLSVLLVAWALRAGGADLYVAADGTPSGPGTLSKPYDLETALSGRAGQAGDTFWLRGGTYSLGHVNTRIHGASGRPITFRSMPGEQPRVDGSFTVWDSQGHVIFRDFELFNSAPERVSSQTRMGFKPTDITITAGIQAYAPNCHFINLVIHDQTRHGIYVSQLSNGNLIYGCLIYNNGWRAPDNAEGHSLYIQGSSGSREVSDNILFNSAGVGMHAYDNGGQPLVGVIMEGNVAFNASVIQNVRAYRDWVIGTDAPSRYVDRIVFKNNLGYRRPGSATYEQVEIGREGVNGTLTMTDNYLPLGLRMNTWTTATVTGNLFARRDTDYAVDLQQGTNALAATWNNNVYSSPVTTEGFRTNSTTYTFAEWQSATGFDESGTNLGASLSGTKVFVRTNRFEPGRAHIVVYNWNNLGTVPVDVSAVLSTGAGYEVRNAQDFFAAPVLKGTFNGQPLTLPMANLSVAAPLGEMLTPPPTGPTFNVFVLRSVAVPENTNTAPSISGVESQVADANTQVGPLQFAVGDAETDAAQLVVTARSSDPALLPAEGIVVGGTGANRVITLRPAANRAGTTTVVVAVSDGSLSSNIRFQLTIRPPAVAITSPTSGTRHTAPAAINLEAVVNAHGNLINSVRFYYGAALLGEDSSPPYTHSLNDVMAGNYAVTARAVYNGSNMAASPPVNLVVTFPQPAAGLTLQATAGTISTPFIVINGIISQAGFTGLDAGGRMTCPFAISEAGNYVIAVQVNAPHEGANSFFVNIDDEPTDPEAIWDVPLTDGFAERVVSWRGTGTPAQSQHVPKVFQLAAGTHQLIIRGREGNCQLGVISIASIDSFDSPALSPQVTVEAMDRSASRVEARSGRFIVTRTGSMAFSMPVAYSLGGTAVNGVDYLAAGASTTIPSGAFSAIVTVTPLPAERLVSTSTLVLTLVPTAAYVVGPSATSAVYIDGNAVRVSDITRDPGGVIRLHWLSGTGRNYRVAARRLLADPWYDLSGVIQADGALQSFVDHGTGAETQRFYTVYVVN